MNILKIDFKRLKNNSRTFGRGPFSTFKLTPDRALNWISLKFSLEGNAILISTNGQSLKGEITLEFWGLNHMFSCRRLRWDHSSPIGWSQKYEKTQFERYVSRI